MQRHGLSQITMTMKFLSDRCVEPKKRWVGGKFTYAVHRFPIKGGITPREMMRLMLIEARYEAQQEILRQLKTSIYLGGNDGKDAAK